MGMAFILKNLLKIAAYSMESNTNKKLVNSSHINKKSVTAPKRSTDTVA